MSTAPRYIPHYTLADYQQWKGDWELWQGVPVAMTPSPFGPHQTCGARLVASLVSVIREANCEAVVLYEIDWIISDDTVVRPDILVLCGEVPERHVTESPALVVEILSPSTAERDRNEKRSLYEDHGVIYYLIVDPNEHTFEAYARNDRGDYQLFPPTVDYEIPPLR